MRRGDHSRNFAFVMDERGGWAPSPAYDLTFAPGPGGEHTMLVAGEGRAPGKDHLIRLAARAELRGASKIIEEVRAATSRFQVFADEAGVPKQAAKQVLQVLRGTMR